MLGGEIMAKSYSAMALHARLSGAMYVTISTASAHTTPEEYPHSPYRLFTQLLQSPAEGENNIQRSSHTAGSLKARRAKHWTTICVPYPATTRRCGHKLRGTFRSMSRSLTAPVEGLWIPQTIPGRHGDRTRTGTGTGTGMHREA